MPWILTPLSEARDGTRILMNTSCVLYPLSHNENTQEKILKTNPPPKPLFPQSLKPSPSRNRTAGQAPTERNLQDVLGILTRVGHRNDHASFCLLLCSLSRGLGPFILGPQHEAQRPKHVTEGKCSGK